MSISQKIVELHNEGKTVSEIKKELGIKYQRVYNTLVMKGLKPRTGGHQNGEKRKKIEEMLREGRSIMEICWELHTYPNYVRLVKMRMKSRVRSKWDRTEGTTT